MEKLAENIEKLITNIAQKVMDSSDTYEEAINNVNKLSSHTVYGPAIKKAIQDKIMSYALNSKINTGHLASISQCLAFKIFNSIPVDKNEALYQKKIISEFKKNPSKFTTLREFLERLNELKTISQSEQRVKD